MKQPVQQKRPNENRGSTQVQGSYEQSVRHGTCMITDTSCESQYATRRTLHHGLRLAGTFDGGVFVSEQLRDDVWLDETTTAGRLQRCSPVRILPIQVNMIPDCSSRYRATMLIQIERMSRLDGTPTGGDNTTSERRREGNASCKHAQTKAGHLGKL